MSETQDQLERLHKCSMHQEQDIRSSISIYR